MNTLKTRIEKIEIAVSAFKHDDWFEIVKANNVERAQEILAERSMTGELETLREMLAHAQVKAREWERDTFGTLQDA